MENPLTSGNASRYAALARLLVRHGRSDLVSGAGLDEFSAGADTAYEDDDDGNTAGRPDTTRADQFARDLEAMGPTYIKLGQLLSTR
ncbi:MAG: hypothetical protein M9923_13785, partial [Phycicoccus sp.]|nr:hypothetical protein [Phycicoccus sp.]